MTIFRTGFELTRYSNGRIDGPTNALTNKVRGTRLKRGNER